MRLSTNTPDLDARLRQRPATDDGFDLHQHLGELLHSVGLDTSDSGGNVEFLGADPIMPSTLRLAGGTGIALAAKSVAVAALWRLRGGQDQHITVDLHRAPHRLCPFYDRTWELINGYPMSDTARVVDTFGMNAFYQCRDERWVHAMGPYPKLRNDMTALLGVPERTDDVRRAIREWDAADLEQAATEAGIVMPMLRTLTELLDSAQYREVLRDLSPVMVEKIGDSDPENFTPHPNSPLDGVRVLGRGHIIAGAGLGRALALHGADVLNVWAPTEYELPVLYASSNVGVRSTMLDLNQPADTATMTGLLRGADIFYANRRPGYLERHRLDAETTAELRPGIIHASVNLNGTHGPWATQVGFDQTAGCLSGVMLAEGSNNTPTLPPIPVVNDYICSWLLQLGCIAALMRRAHEGGSYKVSVSLTRTALWLQSLGTFDKDYAREVAGRAPGHEYLAPHTFAAATALGRYQGVTEQVDMSQTPGHYTYPLVPRGSQDPVWLPRKERP